MPESVEMPAPVSTDDLVGRRRPAARLLDDAVVTHADSLAPRPMGPPPAGQAPVDHALGP